MSPLRWTCKSVRKLAARADARRAIAVSHQTVGELLHDAGLQPAGQPQDARGRAASGPQRAVRAHQRARAKRFQQRGQPVISVDTKKKELVGDFKNAGREWQPKGKPRAGARARLHRRANWARRSPTASTTSARNDGWVSVGIDHDTAAVRGRERSAAGGGRWARKRYPEATRAADHGRWRRQQRRSRRGCGRWNCSDLADETGPDDHRLPLPAGHQQVEQDRASAVLPHHPELARHARW